MAGKDSQVHVTRFHLSGIFTPYEAIENIRKPKDKFQISFKGTTIDQKLFSLKKEKA